MMQERGVGPITVGMTVRRAAKAVAGGPLTPMGGRTLAPPRQTELRVDLAGAPVTDDPTTADALQRRINEARR